MAQKSKPTSFDTLFVNNRWFIWTIVLTLAIGLLTVAYIQYQIGEIDKSAVVTTLLA